MRVVVALLRHHHQLSSMGWSRLPCGRQVLLRPKHGLQCSMPTLCSGGAGRNCMRVRDHSTGDEQHATWVNISLARAMIQALDPVHAWGQSLLPRWCWLAGSGGRAVNPAIAAAFGSQRLSAFNLAPPQQAYSFASAVVVPPAIDNGSTVNSSSVRGGTGSRVGAPSTPGLCGRSALRSLRDETF